MAMIYHFPGVTRGEPITMLIVASVSFAFLLILEWLFWLSPLKPVIERLTRRMGPWFYIVPPHYITRLAVLCAVLWLSDLDLWPVFAGGASWCYSLGLGILFILLSYAAVRVPHPAFWQTVRFWYQEDSLSFVLNVVYLVVYPGFVEELLFRWFFTAALWPMFGWWTLVVSPLLNILWHLPVWIDLTRAQTPRGENRQAMLVGMAGPATTFAIALTAIAMVTHNLIGPVLVHAFGDWCGLVLQRSSHHPAADDASGEQDQAYSGGV